MTHVFISYSRKDIEIARKLAESLQGREIEYWIDWKGIPPSVDWRREIQKGIEEADAFLFLLSPESAQSSVCREELDHAVRNGKRLIPIVVREVERDRRPEPLKPLNFIFLRDGDDFEVTFPRLITAIETDHVWVQAHRQLQVKALEWERNNQENSFLLRGRELQDAESEFVSNTGKEPLPTELQRTYILISRRVSDRQRRLTTGIAIAAAVVMAGLAIYGFLQARLANERAILALARQLSAQAQSLLGSGPEREKTAVLLAAQSMRLSPSGDAAQVLQNHTLARQIAQFTQASDVYCLAFSPDGRYVVSGSRDGTVSVWEAASGKEIMRKTHDEWVIAVAFSPDGTYVASAGNLKTRVWEIPSGREITQLIHEDVVLSIAISPDGKYLVTGAGDIAQVWEAESGSKVTQLIHDSAVTTVAFSPDGRSIASGSDDGTVHVWETASGKMISDMVHGGGLCPLVFSQDGKYIAGGGGDNLVYVWEAATGRQIAVMEHQGIVNAVALNQDGSLVISAGALTAQVWNVSTQQELSRWTHNSDVYSVAFSPNGRDVASASADGTARVWDASSGREIAHMMRDAYLWSIAFSPDGKYVVSGGCRVSDETGSCSEGVARVWAASASKAVATMDQDGSVFTMAFSPDSKFLVSAVCLRYETGSGCVESSAGVWEAATGRQTARVTYQDSMDSLAFSPDAIQVLSAGKRTARVWEAAGGREIAHMDYGEERGSAVFSPDGSVLVSGSPDGSIGIWEVRSGRELIQMKHEGGLKFLSFGPQGDFVVSAGGKSLRVWDVSSGREIAHMDHDQEVVSVAFSTDGATLVSTSLGGTAQVWEASTGRELVRLQHGRLVQATALSPDGKYVVLTGCDVAEEGFTFSCPQASARVWEVSTGKPVASVIHDDVPLAVAFSADGKYVASVGCARWNPEFVCIESRARVWETVSGREIARMTHDRLMVAVAFSPDGKFIATGSEGAAQIWSWQPDDVIASACAYVKRNLSPAEWDQYIGAALPYPENQEDAVCPGFALAPQVTATPSSIPLQAP
jgi:WD40 repeat protein